MTRLYVDGPTVIRAVAAAVANLEAHVEEVDSLNVFPVPDGDTGSNMLATMRAALAEAERLPEDQRDLNSVAEALSRGALSGARGNSGVILSQIIRGMTHGADGRRRANGLDLAQGLRRGSEVAYGAVLTPVEGTILTVIRDAAEAAESAAGRQPHVEAVLGEVIAAAASSVQRTPQLLPVLEDAGVVDSGGQGLYRLLEGTLQVQGGRWRRRGSPLPWAAEPYAPPAPSFLAESPRRDDDVSHLQEGHVHGYETEYLLASSEGGIDVTALRAAILASGDSVVVAGDERLVRVHVHGERPDLAIAAGLRWGRLSSVSIKDLDDQVAERCATAAVVTRPPAPPPQPAPTLAMVAVAQADGFARALESLGARIVRPAHGSRPSVGEIAEAILAIGAPEVILLPDDRDAVMAARHAAELTPLVNVEVIPTRNVAEGIAAAVAFDAAASLSQNAGRMAAESAALRSFTVLTAARDAVIDSQPVQQGQVIALDAGRRLLVQAGSVEEALLRALATYEDFELVTCYVGAGVDAGQGQELRERIAEAFSGVEVEIVVGGQSSEHLLVAVE